MALQLTMLLHVRNDSMHSANVSSVLALNRAEKLTHSHGILSRKGERITGTLLPFSYKFSRPM